MTSLVRSVPLDPSAVILPLPLSRLVAPEFCMHLPPAPLMGVAQMSTLGCQDHLFVAYKTIRPVPALHRKANFWVFEPFRCSDARITVLLLTRRLDLSQPGQPEDHFFCVGA